eukprot:30853-Pelagococcus_subviridis.AAC.1
MKRASEHRDDAFDGDESFGVTCRARDQSGGRGGRRQPSISHSFPLVAIFAAAERRARPAHGRVADIVERTSRRGIHRGPLRRPPRRPRDRVLPLAPSRRRAGARETTAARRSRGGRGRSGAARRRRAARPRGAS